MSRSTRAKAEATRERILETASSLFSERGYSGVSVGEIMAAVGLTVGGFYNHFPSKEALAVEACTNSFRKEMQIWNTYLTNTSSCSDEALPKLAQRYLSATDKGTNCPIIAFNSDAVAVQHVDSIAKAYTQGTKLLLEALLVAASGRASSDYSRDRGLLLFAALVGAKLIGRAAPQEPWMREIRLAVLRQTDIVHKLLR